MKRCEVRYEPSIVIARPWVVALGKMVVSRHESEAAAERVSVKCNALLDRSSLSKMIVDTLKREIK